MWVPPSLGSRKNALRICILRHAPAHSISYAMARYVAAPLLLLCVSAQTPTPTASSMSVSATPSNSMAAPAAAGSPAPVATYMFCSSSVNSASINSGAIADVYTNAGALQGTGSYFNYQDCRA